MTSSVALSPKKAKNNPPKVAKVATDVVEKATPAKSAAVNAVTLQPTLPKKKMKFGVRKLTKGLGEAVA